MASQVYFADLHAGYGENLPQKLQRLIKTAGLGKLDLDRKFVAIKTHFGEPGNMAYLRPQWAAAVAEVVRQQGGTPYLVDCNTLYVGGRKNALAHLESAYKNGYTPYATGCQILIGDGLKGTDEVEVPVEGGEYVTSAKIGRGVLDADVLISLSHFKGHVSAGFGGALKNIGMGCGSRAGKMEMHNAGRPVVEQSLCVGCGMCTTQCAHDAAVVENGKAHIEADKCVGCGHCLSACPRDAIAPLWDEAAVVMNRKIAEYTKAAINGRPSFHISVVLDVSPNCDCDCFNGAAIVPNVGLFASFDPVALDMACADAVNAMPPIPGSEAERHDAHDSHDHFTYMHPDTDWMAALAHGEKLGLGTRQYELIRI